MQTKIKESVRTPRPQKENNPGFEPNHTKPSLCLSYGHSTVEAEKILKPGLVIFNSRYTELPVRDVLRLKGKKAFAGLSISMALMVRTIISVVNMSLVSTVNTY